MEEIVRESGEVNTSVTHSAKVEGEKVETEIKNENQVIPNIPVNKDCARVEYKAGMTLSLGKGSFEFARIDLGISYPCNKDEIHGTLETCKKFIDEKLSTEVANIRQWVEENRKKS